MDEKWLRELREDVHRAPIPSVFNKELPIPADEHVHLQVRATMLVQALADPKSERTAELAKALGVPVGDTARLILSALEQIYIAGRLYGRMEIPAGDD